MIKEQLHQAWLKRKKYVLQNKLEAYRLVHRGEFGWDLAIDIYSDNAIIHLFNGKEAGKVATIEHAIKELLPITNFYYKDRTKDGQFTSNGKAASSTVLSKSHQKQHSNPLISTLYLEVENNAPLPSTRYQDAQKKEIIVNEYGHKFLINLSDYLDLGLFLDHRETRRWVGKESEDKVVLNTFAYTGSFSIYAAKGGAKKTYSVDLSKTYCDWIKKNLELNQLSPETNWVYKMDTLEFFHYAFKKNLKFDIIVIDPPTFSRNKNQRFSVQADHLKLLEAAGAVLNTDGLIIFSNNCLSFKLHPALKNVFRIENITEETIPVDFPFGGKNQPIHNCFLLRK